MAEDAVGYFLAAKKVVAGEGPVQIIAHYRMPLNFLLGQSCELALKAMLVSKGWDRKRLNPIRHDLMSLLDEARKEDFTITQGFEDYCRPPWIGHDDAFKILEPQIRAIAPFGMP